MPAGTDERVKTLSQLLRALPYHSQASRKESFRNPDGVSFKLQNLRQIATGKGLGNVSTMDRIIWDEFGSRPDEVRRQVNLIKAGIEITEIAGDDTDDEVEFVEGRVVTVAHKRRERNHHLRRKLITKLKKTGALTCELCSCVESTFKFGEAIFEAHHVLPLSVGTERNTKLQDLALLCANCHRIIHRAISDHKQWLTIAETKSILSR